MFTLLLKVQGAADSVCALLQAVFITPTAGPELSQLDQQITGVACQVSSKVVDILNHDRQTVDVDDNVSRVITRVTELHSTKPDGCGDDIAYLHEKERQLREKKKQLRKKVWQLREEELQLREKEWQLREERLPAAAQVRHLSVVSVLVQHLCCLCNSLTYSLSQVLFMRLDVALQTTSGSGCECL